MQVKLDENFWNEIKAHYAQGMTVDTFALGGIHCWAFNASGNEFPGVEKDRRLFEFCKPFGTPIYAYVNEDINDNMSFDTVEFAFIRVKDCTEEIEIVEKHSQETKEEKICECEDCSC